LFSHTPSEENSQAGTTEAIEVHGILDLGGYQGPTGQLSDLCLSLQPGQLIVDTRQPALLATAYFLGVVSRLGQPVFSSTGSHQSIKLV